MPAHGVEIIDGIPVILKDGEMYAFQPGVTTVPAICLGTYSSVTKTATWAVTEPMTAWMSSYRETLVARSRK